MIKGWRPRVRWLTLVVPHGPGQELVEPHLFAGHAVSFRNTRALDPEDCTPATHSQKSQPAALVAVLPRPRAQHLRRAAVFLRC